MKTNRYFSVGAAAVVLFLAACMSSTASAEMIIAQDEFLVPADYTGASSPSTGSPSTTWLANQGAGAGTGFTGNWVTGGNQYVLDSDTTLSVTGRSSPVGSVVSTFASSLTSTRTFDSTAQARLDTANRVRFSFLFRSTGTGGTNGLRLDTDAGGTVFISQRLGGYQTQLTGGSLGGNEFLFNGTGFSANTTYLLAGQLDIDRVGTNAETLKLWAVQDAADAYVDGTEILSVSLNVLDAANPGLPSLTLFKNQAGPIWDSIQVSVSTPEPSTFVLASLSLCGLAFSRRRRRR